MFSFMLEGEALGYIINFGKNLFICHFSNNLSVISVSVVVGREGRLVLPKRLREKYGVGEGSRLIVRDYGGQIVLIPVKLYEDPAEALHGSVRLGRLVKKPKEVARRHVRKLLLEDLE